jgi:hypothetical protein
MIEENYPEKELLRDVKGDLELPLRSDVCWVLSL